MARKRKGATLLATTSLKLPVGLSKIKLDRTGLGRCGYRTRPARDGRGPATQRDRAHSCCFRHPRRNTRLRTSPVRAPKIPPRVHTHQSCFLPLVKSSPKVVASSARNKQNVAPLSMLAASQTLLFHSRRLCGCAHIGQSSSVRDQARASDRHPFSSVRRGSLSQPPHLLAPFVSGLGRGFWGAVDKPFKSNSPVKSESTNRNSNDNTR